MSCEDVVRKDIAALGEGLDWKTQVLNRGN